MFNIVLAELATLVLVVTLLPLLLVLLRRA